MLSHVLLSSQDCAQVLEQAEWWLPMFFGFCPVGSAEQNHGLSVFLSSEASPAMLRAPRQQSLPFPQSLSGFFFNIHLAWQAPIRCFRKPGSG